MSASLGEAHMHFREVPLIQHEIQLKTWSASRSPALIQRQIPAEDEEPRRQSRASVGVSATSTSSKQTFKKICCIVAAWCVLCFGCTVSQTGL